MEILYTLLIGLVVGIIAKFLIPGKDPGGCILTTIIGIAGAMLAKFIGEALDWYAPNETAGFIASIGGAILLLLLFRLVTGRRGR